MKKATAAVIRDLDETKSVKATVEDENTISIDAMEYKEFKAKSVTQPYLVAIVNRKGHRYDFGGICDNRAFFSRNLNA